LFSYRVIAQLPDNNHTDHPNKPFATTHN